MIKRITFLLILLMVFVIVVACDNQNTNASNIISASPLDISKYVKIEKFDKDMYKIFLKDEKKNVIFEEEYPVEPIINVIYENIIQITISLGSPNSYVYFYDEKSERVSAVFYNPLLIQEGFILFMDDEGKLIFRDIFDENKMYKEIARGFSPTAVPSDAITNAELNDKELMIEYYEGTEFLEKKEYFTLE